MSGRRNTAVVCAAVAIIAAMAYSPIYFKNRMVSVSAAGSRFISAQSRNLYASDKPLTGSEVMRGPYMNVGSQDAGRDPDWDFARGVRKGYEKRDPV
jgi:hypothetical protein